MNQSHSSKKVSFIGSNKQEVLLMLGKILNLMDLRCAVIDATAEQNLKYIIPVVVMDEEIITYKGVDYMINVHTPEDYNRLTLNLYDVIIVDYGFNELFLEALAQENQLFLVTDFMKYNIEKSFQLINKLENAEIIKIYKDVIQSKISPKYIDRKLFNNTSHKVIADYIFYLDEKTSVNYMNIQYGDQVKQSNIPEGYKVFIIDLLDELFGFEIKSIKKIFKKRSRRNLDASCILEHRTWSDSNHEQFDCDSIDDCLRIQV